MNDIVQATLQRKVLLGEVGKSILNVKYPDEFELYLIALELVSAASSQDTLMYFVFPIMPNSMSETEKMGTNIIKTAGGIVTLSNSTFIPIPIVLSGTFGRSLKYVIGGDSFFDLVQGFSLKNKKTTFKEIEKALFDQNIKTGYGCCKILQNIIRESKLVDENGPRTLYYHNLAFNSRYIVKADEIVFSQEIGASNMIWNYRLSLTAVGKASTFQKPDKFNQLSNTLAVSNVIQKDGANIVSELQRILK